MKTFSELAECLARIPPKITLYGPLFKYNYVGCLLLLMFSRDLLFAIKREAYIFTEPGWLCRFPKHQKLDEWTMAGEKRQTCSLLKLIFRVIYKAIMIDRNLIDNFYADIFCVRFCPVQSIMAPGSCRYCVRHHEEGISVVYPTLSLIKFFTDLFQEHSVLTSGRVFLKLLPNNIIISTFEWINVSHARF